MRHIKTNVLYFGEGVDAAKLLNQPAESKQFACLFLSVASEFGGKGIAKELLARSEAKAKEIPGVTIAVVCINIFIRI